MIGEKLNRRRTVEGDGGSDHNGWMVAGRGELLFSAHQIGEQFVTLFTCQHLVNRRRGEFVC